MSTDLEQVGVGVDIMIPLHHLPRHTLMRTIRAGRRANHPK